MKNHLTYLRDYFNSTIQDINIERINDFRFHKNIYNDFKVDLVLYYDIARTKISIQYLYNVRDKIISNITKYNNNVTDADINCEDMTVYYNKKRGKVLLRFAVEDTSESANHYRSDIVNKIEYVKHFINKRHDNIKGMSVDVQGKRHVIIGWYDSGKQVRAETIRGGVPSQCLIEPSHIYNQVYKPKHDRVQNILDLL